MKNNKTFYSKFLLLIAGVLIAGACAKEEIKAVILSPSAVNVAIAASAPTLVLDSTNAKTAIAETLTWNAADFGAALSVNYTLEVDSATGTFANPTKYDMGKALTKSFTKKELNELAQSLRLKAGVAGQIKTRVRAVVSTSVEPVFSNTQNLTITTYSAKPTPKFPVPTNLFIVGDATPGGWNNPVPAPTQKLTRIDDNTFGIILNLSAGAHYLLLPVNGDWSHKYAVGTSGANPASDNFGPDLANDIPAPAASGTYKIVVDFVTGKYTTTLLASNPIPANLFIVGDATPGGWNNPVPVPSQQLTQLSNSEFQVDLALVGGNHYLLLPVNGDWTNKYAVANKNTANPLNDVFAKNASDDIPAPGVSATYRINVNFLTMKYTLVKL
jgi:hypothetical protein